MSSSAPFSPIMSLRPYDCVWRSISQGLMPPGTTCSTLCWTHGPAWTGWKNSSETFSDYGARLIDDTQLSAFKSTMLGTLRRSGSATAPSATNTPALKNVQQLRTLRYLTSGVRRELLTQTPVHAMRRWSRFACDIAAWQTSGKMSSRSSRPANSSPLLTGKPWSDRTSDPLADVIRIWKEYSNGL